MAPCIVSVFQYISNKIQRYTVYFIWKLLYMFRVVQPPIIRSANNCIYSICYLSHRYCYLPLSWKSWNRFECAVGGVRHPQHTQTVVTARRAVTTEQGWRTQPTQHHTVTRGCMCCGGRLLMMDTTVSETCRTT
jgi:hypothetical protein